MLTPRTSTPSLFQVYEVASSPSDVKELAAAPPLVFEEKLFCLLVLPLLCTAPSCLSPSIEEREASSNTIVTKSRKRKLTNNTHSYIRDRERERGDTTLGTKRRVVPPHKESSLLPNGIKILYKHRSLA